jgi:hypothetical protein
MTPPLPEVSPFSSSDDFCTKVSDPPPVPLLDSAPGFTGTAVAVAVVLAPGSDVAGPTAAAVQRFAQLVNQCGGVQGRRLQARTITATRDAQTDCTALVGGGPYAAIAAAGSVPAAPCIATRGSAVVVAPDTTAANSLLASTHGRLFVGGSSEGTLETRLQDLVEHADLGDSAFAVVSERGNPADVTFADSLDAALTANGLRPARRIEIDPATPASLTAAAHALEIAHIRAVLSRHADPGLVRSLAATSTPPTVYALADSNAHDAGNWSAADRDVTTRVPVETWLEPDDAAAREGLGPSDFARQCTEWLAAASPRRTTTTTAVAEPPDVGTTNACLAVRLLARGLQLAGPNPRQHDIERAFHDLPYTDVARPSGTPTERPNQLLNEPVTRAARVVVRDRLAIPCAPAPTNRTSSTPVACWVPVGGYGDGGKAVIGRLARAAVS